MKNRSNWIGMRIMLVATLSIIFGISQSYAQSSDGTEKPLKLRGGRLTTAEKKAAAKRAAKLGLLPGVAGVKSNAEASGNLVGIQALGATSGGLASTNGAAPLAGIEGPGGVPHYFGPYANWAFSPLPKGEIGSITVDSGGSGYTAPAVEILDAYGTPTVTATATATLSGGVITAITVTNAGAGYTAPVVSITDSTGVDAVATANLTNLTGGLRKFIDKMPGLGEAQANNITQTHGKGQYIPVAVPENKTFSGQVSDYYEIAVVEFSEKLHSDLPPTRVRGYVQLSTATNPGAQIPLTYINGNPIYYPGTSTQVKAYDHPHYLGPLIVATGRVQGIANTNPGDPGYPKPVRVKFWNLLPSGAGGNLFIPVDETIPGSGLGPAGPGIAGSKYAQNRATVHLHGNNTVWISDGTVHQWITPGTENTPYPKGVSVRNVPDMKDGSNNVECDAPNSGCMTLFYTNAQSARLQFYHDHSLGITRLNVYAGEAAGYLITDAVEQDMINGTNETGVNPNLLKVLPDTGIPLIIQDKTFVDADTIYAQDPTWNWGTKPSGEANTGDLWYPHVYMPVQNPWDLTGTNGFGRWHYGPWFNPPVPECVNGGPVGCIEVGAVPNEYYQPVCDGLPDSQNSECTAPWEPPLRPGVPNPSMPGESFFDTPLVNGTAYPYIELEPKPYRFRVLNASNDRFVNLQLYVAADKTTPTTPGLEGTALCTGAVDVANCTEVKMVPVNVAPANQYADTPSGIPDPNTKGPDWIQIGTEGGFKPKPLVIPATPIGYNLDPAYFAFGIVNQHSLFLGAAERADVVVDFSQYAGKTLILYNDSPAPVPAGAAPYDFYTGNGNQMDGGGAPNTQPGYGPNTRTVMQIRIAATANAPLNGDVTLANLNAVFAKTNSKRGVFEVSQDPIIIPQAAYNSAYNNTFTATADQFIKIADISKTFRPINASGTLQTAVTMPLEMKAMHDEMGGVYDMMFGRMSGMLGLSLHNSPNHVLIPYNLASPPTDLVKSSTEASQIGVLPDGTQIWRIFHNGVDTHPIHVHLFNAQLINRVGQDGQGSAADPIDLGWKETFRINPLEVTYLAMRPVVPTQSQVPFEVPDSVRLIDPTLPEGATLPPPPPAGWFDPEGNSINEISNHYVNFGWEYVWHCHILSHEEMDMMHSLNMVVPPMAPTNLSAVAAAGPIVNLSWTDNSQKEAKYVVERSTNSAFTTGLTTFDVTGNTLTTGAINYSDTSVANNMKYWYRVYAIGSPVGDTQVYAGSPNGFPTMSANSLSGKAVVQVGAAPSRPANPTSLTATVKVGPQVLLSWTDNATNETGFAIGRCTGIGCVNFSSIKTVDAKSGTGNVTYVDTAVTWGTSYSYRVYAVNSANSSASPTNTVSASVPAIPAAPTNFIATGGTTPPGYLITLSWTAASDPYSFSIQRASNSSFTSDLATLNINKTKRSFVIAGTAKTTYYFRIRANNGAGGSSPWVNVQPFPIRTGN